MRVWIILFIVLLWSLPAICGEKVLFDKQIDVARSDFREVHFRVPDDAGGKVEFSGKFNTMGGLNDDITFSAFDQQNYVNWFNQHKHRKLVHFEKTKRSEFRFEAQPGQTYYFVLNNFFSSVSGKKVDLQVKLLTEDTPSSQEDTKP